MNEQIQEIRYLVGEAWKGEYNSATTYGNANVVQDPTGLSVYRSLKPGNVGHPVTDTNWWFCIVNLSSIKAESDRIAALNQAIAQDETLRVAAEELRQQKEAEREAAETQRNEGEQNRISAEQQRVSAEQQRASQEQTRISQEQSRVAAEQGRVAAEAQRVQKEQLRENSEAQRVINETNRVAAEAERMAQYAADHQQALADHDQYVIDNAQLTGLVERADADHVQAGQDHTRAESDHGIAADDHTQAGNDHTRAESDHGIAADDHTQAGNDHTRAESDHTRAESDHAAVEVYVDSLGAFDISSYHATGGVLAKYADLTAALGTNGANIPDALRKGGMSVKFVLSSDNKYIQYICTSQNFSTTPSDWKLAIGIEELRNNYYDVVPGVYLSMNGDEINSASYNASSFIKVTANALYFCDTPHNICIYDITKKFIELATVSNHTFITSANAYYVRFSYPTTKNPVFYAVDSRRYRERACDLWAEKIDSLAFSLRWTKKGYYSYGNGQWTADESYSSTNFIEINSSHRIYLKTLIYNYFNENFEWISGGTNGQGGIITIPATAKYIVVSKPNSSTLGEIIIDYDDPTFNIAQKSDSFSNVKFPKEIHCNFKDNDYKEYGIELASGQAGSVGAVYSVPIKYDGKYAMRIRYKMPRSIQGSTVTQFTLAEMRAWQDATHTQGGIHADLVSGASTANPPYQQAKYNAYVRVGATSSYSGNFSALFRPMHRFNSSEDYSNCKPWVGEDVFSIRYLGDISVAANQDVVYSISSQGLVIKHSTDDSIILSETFPVSDSLRDFMQTLYMKTQEGGDYYGIIEFDFLSGENLKCSDLIEVTDIPMVGDYTSDSATKGVQAFPCFVSVYDDSEHTIEFRYNGTLGAYDENTWGSRQNYMRHMFAVLFDGKYVGFTDARVEAYSDPSYKGYLRLGCSDVLITGFDFTADKTQLWSPRIHIYMGHALSDGVVTSTPALTSVGQMEGIIELHKKYGFQYVSLEEISKYMNGEELPSRDVYTIIHDDYHYLADDSGVARKYRDLYTKNDIKAAFAIINELNSQYYDEIKSDATLFGFHLHDTENYPTYGYSELLSQLRQEAETFRTNAFDTNIFTYPGGKYDDNIVHIMKKEGFAICTIVGGGAASLANYPNSLPRTNTADVATSLASIEDELKFDVSL